MPRNGSGVYSHPFPDVVEGTTIESAVFNGNTSDVEQDLNTPRPIVAGGTGANNARDAMIALSGEIAKQLVTNFDSFPWVNGSFYSAAGATSAPNAANRFAGIYYENADASFATIEARDQDAGQLYLRHKVAGVWSAWSQQTGAITDMDARYVNVTGDTMSGPLIVPVKGNQMGVHGGAGGTTAVPITDANIVLYNSGANNWAGIGVDSAGSVWLRAGNSGTPSPALFINAQNLGTSFNGPVTAGYTTTTGTYYFGNSGTKSLSYDSIRFVFTGGPIQSLSDSNQLGNADGQSWTAALTTADANLVFYGGGGNWAGIGTDTGGNMYFRTGLSGAGPAAFVIQNDQTIYATASIGVQKLSAGFYSKLRFDSANTSSFETNATQTNHMIRSGGNGYYWVKNDTGFEGGANQATLAAITPAGVLTSYVGRLSSRGGPTDINSIYMYTNDGVATGMWKNGADTNLFMGRLDANGNSYATYWRGDAGSFFATNLAYKPGGGSWSDSSDARIKNVLGDYTSGLDAVTALQPVRFTYKGNDTLAGETPTHPPTLDEDGVVREVSKSVPTVPYGNSTHYQVAKDAKEFIGLIAQAAEVTMPELVTKREGMIDGQAVTDLRDIDTTPLIFALINAVKELKAEVDALKAAR